MPAYVEIYIDQGSNFNNIINLTNDVTNTPINVAGYTISSQLRRSYYSANASGNLTCSVTDAANGEITMTMTPANTANLRAGRYVFDVRLEDATGAVSRPLEGMVTVTPRVSR
jgi:hypothetical protein